MSNGNQKVVLDKKQIETVSRLAGIGANLDETAHILGVAPCTLDKIIERQPEVAQAIEKGKAEAHDAVMSTAFKMAISGKHPVMTIFWLKVRKKWRESRLDDADDETTKSEFKLNYKE